MASLVFERLPATLSLMIPTLLLAFVTGSVMGIIAARRVGRWSDAAISVAALAFYAMPIFWIGVMMIVLFGVKLGWFPTGGMVTSEPVITASPISSMSRATWCCQS